MKRSRPASYGLFYVLLAFCTTESLCLAQTTFERTYGGSKDDFAQSVQQTSDGGYIIVGYTYSFGAGSSDIYLIKTNSVGDTLWTRTYGGFSHDAAYWVQQTSDGGYIIAGNISLQSGDGDTRAYGYLVKTNSSGDTLWTRSYGMPAIALSVQQTHDGGYVIAGDRSFMKTSPTGDTLWTRSYFSGSSQSIRQTSDGGYIALGDTSWYYSTLVWFTWPFLARTDLSGDKIWTRMYGPQYSVTNGMSLQQTSDSGFVVAGWTYEWGGNGPDFYLVKTNSSGDTVWTRTYGGLTGDQAYAVQQTSDGGYIIAGCTSSFTMGLVDHVYLIKTNPSGDTLWTRIYGDTNSNSRGLSVQQTTDGGYVVCGYSSPFGGGHSKVYLVKTGPDGLVTSVDQKRKILPITFALEQNYPNPFNPFTTIKYTIGGTRDLGPALSGAEGLGARKTLLVVYDVLGRQVATLVNESKLPGSYEVTFDGSRLPSGVYFYRMEAGSFVTTKKLLLIR